MATAPTQERRFNSECSELKVRGRLAPGSALVFGFQPNIRRARTNRHVVHGAVIEGEIPFWDRSEVTMSEKQLLESKRNEGCRGL